MKCKANSPRRSRWNDCRVGSTVMWTKRDDLTLSRNPALKMTPPNSVELELLMVTGTNSSVGRLANFQVGHPRNQQYGNVHLERFAAIGNNSVDLLQRICTQNTLPIDGCKRLDRALGPAIMTSPTCWAPVTSQDIA